MNMTFIEEITDTGWKVAHQEPCALVLGDGREFAVVRRRDLQVRYYGTIEEAINAVICERLVNG